MHDVERAVQLVRRRVATAKDWLSIGEGVVMVESVLYQLSQVLLEAQAQQAGEGEGAAPEAELFQSLLVALPQQALREVQAALAQVDWELTTEYDSLVPADQVSATLDRARQRFHDMPALLAHEQRAAVAHWGAARVEEVGLQVAFFPIIGFLVRRVRPGGGGAADGAGAGARAALLASLELEPFFSDVDGESGLEWEYLRGPFTQALNERHGDPATLVRDEELSVVRDVEKAVAGREASLLQSALACSTVDVLLAFADAARDHGWARPSMVDGPPRTLLHAVVHPLLSHNVERYVANDVRLVGGDEVGRAPHIMLLTGPNYSGKSALLKTVGLVSVMAQCGSYVPASAAELGICDRILTRIESVESLTALHESAFTMDAQQVASMLLHATPRSLLLVDEFGKGTTALDAAALLTAVTHALSTRPGGAPRTIITTHFIEILDTELLQSCIMDIDPSEAPTARRNVMLCEMKVLLLGDDASDGDVSDEELCGPSSSDEEGRGQGGGREQARAQGLKQDREQEKAELEMGLQREEELEELDDGAAGASHRPVPARSLPSALRARSVEPLFELAEGGKSTQSYALSCARRARVPRGVLRRAQVHLQMARYGLTPSPGRPQDDERRVTALDEIISPSRNLAGAPIHEIRALLGRY